MSDGSDLSRGTPKRQHTLRRQPGSSSPGVHPALDSWLAARSPSAVAKLTPEELRQWKLDEGGTPRPPRTCLYITFIIFRVLSLVSAFTLAVLGIRQLPNFGGSISELRLLPLIIPGVLISVWDGAEFLFLCVRKNHKGMPRLAHLSVDAIIIILVGASIAGWWVGLAHLDFWDGYMVYSLGGVEFRITLLLLIILLLIHASFLICFPCCGHRFRRNEHVSSPRIMYLPGTGEAVVVLARPYPPEPTHRQEQRKPSASPVIELNTLPAADGEVSVPSPVFPQPIVVAEPEPSPMAAGPSQPTAIVPDPGRPRPSLQRVPPRKPLPGLMAAGTHYATPWPAGHVPDEAELARAARGEAQAQWMTLARSKLDLGDRGRIAEDPAREGEKSDLVLGLGSPADRKS